MGSEGGDAGDTRGQKGRLYALTPGADDTPTASSATAGCTRSQGGGQPCHHPAAPQHLVRDHHDHSPPFWGYSNLPRKVQTKA